MNGFYIFGNKEVMLMFSIENVDSGSQNSVSPKSHSVMTINIQVSSQERFARWRIVDFPKGRV